MEKKAKKKMAVASALGLAEIIADKEAIAGEMAANIASTSAEIASIESAGTTMEMVTFAGGETSVMAMGEGIADTTFAATESMGELGGGIAESAEMTAGEMANSMEAANTANSAIGQSLTESTVGEEIELQEFGSSVIRGTTSGEGVISSTPFTEIPASSSWFGDMSEIANVEDEDLFGPGPEEDDLFGSVPRTLFNTTSRTINKSLLGVTIAGAGTSATLVGVGISSAGSTSALLGGTTAGSTLLSGTTAVGTGAAVGQLTSQVLLAIGVPAGSALGAGVYKIVTELENYLPGTSDYLIQAYENGEIKINKDNVLTWLDLLKENTGIMAKLKAAGTDVAMMPDGSIVKVGSAIAKVLKSPIPPATDIIHNDTNTNNIIKAKNHMLRNLKTDVVKDYWKAATMF